MFEKWIECQSITSASQSDDKVVIASDTSIYCLVKQDVIMLQSWHFMISVELFILNDEGKKKMGCCHAQHEFPFFLLPLSSRFYWFLIFQHSPHLQVYKVILEMVFKIAPILLIASLNVRIMIVYNQTCNNRRRMTLSHANNDDSRKFSEERRLMFLLGENVVLLVSIVKVSLY